MADEERDEMMQRAGSQAVAFVRSVALLALVVVGAPWALMAAARARFDGAAPFHGVPAPTDWELDRIRAALTDRLTDRTIADVVIRLALFVAWVAVAVLVATIVAELVHMIRHRGLAMPDIRGLGMPQSVARVIAAGLLVVVPMFANPNRAGANDGTRLIPAARAAGAVDAGPVDAGLPDNVWMSRDAVVGIDEPAVGEPELVTAAPVGPAASDQYIVVAGDSIYSIAERQVGPDQQAVAAYADRLIDLNLGQQMPDGQRFLNAAYIEPGWLLQLPASPSSIAQVEAVGATASHVVDEGESLWSIADDELGDAERWPEIFEANEGRTFDDGRRLEDPDLIQPGWVLAVPGVDTEESVDGEVVTPENDPAPTTFDAETPSGTIEDAVEDVIDVGADRSVPDNVWESRPEAKPAVVASPLPAPSDGGGVDPVGPGSDRSPVTDPADQELPELLTLGRAAMLSGGVLTLLAVRRRNQLRRARPRARLPEPAPAIVATERVLRSIDPGERFARVDVAIRAAASSLIAHHARLLAVTVQPDGAVDVLASSSVVLDAPWEGAVDRWHLPAVTPLELLAEQARRVGAPTPTLVQLGRDEFGGDVYVDLEGLEALEVGGPGDHADAIVAALAVTLAGSVLAEVTTLVGLGVPDDAFLGHRLHVPVRDPQRAFEAVADAIGSTASQTRSTFELRCRATAGETWEPAVVFAGSAVGNVVAPSNRTGMAIVSASPIQGPSSRLAPDGDAWLLLPAGIRLIPVGLRPEHLDSLASLVAVAEPIDAEPVDVESIGREPEAAGESIESKQVDDDLTLVPPSDHELSSRVQADDPDPVLDLVAARATDHSTDHSTDRATSDTPAIDWSILVRLVGPVAVARADGAGVEFERSKTRELVAWLATHRSRSTRSSARTALWELDVRDSTFANVVSEARRSLARLVPPPGDDEWVGRTMTDALPLHPLVKSDADVIEFALEVARIQPPAQAIATLTPAVELIEGVPFEGTSYLWPDAEGITSNLVLLATAAATELAAHCLSVGDIEGVFAATGRGLRVLPGHEALIGLRMQAHARAGDHAGVRHEWESYERVITADPWSDGEPSPKLVDLRRELLNPSR